MSAALAYTDASATARALHVLDRTQLAAWRTTQSATVNAWIDAQGFAAGAGSLLLLPGEDGLAGTIIGIGDPLDPYSYAHAPFGLPAGDWQLASHGLPARVDFVEDLGDSLIVHLNIEGQRAKLKAAPSARPPQEGQDICLQFCPEAAHLFDRTSGERL